MTAADRGHTASVASGHAGAPAAAPVKTGRAAHGEAPDAATPPAEPRADRAVVVASVPRLALTVEEACKALGVSWDTWAARIAPDVRIVRLGSRKLVPVVELERWLEREAALALDDRHTSPAETAVSVGSSRGARQRRAIRRTA